MNLIDELMKTNVTKWGNSLAIRLPKSFTNQLNIDQDSKVELFLEKDKIILKKSKYDLKDLMSKVTPPNIHKETETGPVTGKEQW